MTNRETEWWKKAEMERTKRENEIKRKIEERTRRENEREKKEKRKREIEEKKRREEREKGVRIGIDGKKYWLDKDGNWTLANTPSQNPIGWICCLGGLIILFIMAVTGWPGQITP